MKPEGRTVIPAYIGLGSNLSSPSEQLENAFERLTLIPDTELIARSSLYRSAPLADMEQPDYINAVAKLATLLDAFELLEQLQEIENAHGRVRAERWGPRVLDLDLLVYGDQQINTATLTVPHPGISERNFVLLPLREVEPDLLIPGLAPLSDIAVDETTPGISRVN